MAIQCVGRTLREMDVKAFVTSMQLGARSDNTEEDKSQYLQNNKDGLVRVTRTN